MRFMKFDATGRLVSVRIPRALTRFGRLRSVTVALDGDLLVTTSNGRNDSVLRVHPCPDVLRKEIRPPFRTTRRPLARHIPTTKEST